MGIWKKFISSMDLNSDKEEKEIITPMYCKECGRRYNVSGNLGLQPESIIGILLSFIIGLGFIRKKSAVCSYCDGKLKRYKGQELKIKNFSWAEPRTISASELKIAEKKDNDNFISMLKWLGILIGIFILFIIGSRVYYKFFG